MAYGKYIRYNLMDSWWSSDPQATRTPKGQEHSGRAAPEDAPGGLNEAHKEASISKPHTVSLFLLSSVSALFPRWRTNQCVEETNDFKRPK